MKNYSTYIKCIKKFCFNCLKILINKRTKEIYASEKLIASSTSLIIFKLLRRHYYFFTSNFLILVRVVVQVSMKMELAKIEGSGF